MNDPVGLIGRNGGTAARDLRPRVDQPTTDAQGRDFKSLLVDEIAQVNEMQGDAARALEDLSTGRRTDIETVIMATEKADTAFRLLMQVRNKMLDAYEELKQMRI